MFSFWLMFTYRRSMGDEGTLGWKWMAFTLVVKYLLTVCYCVRLLLAV